MSDNILKRKRKRRNEQDQGAPPLELRELTGEMKDLAMLDAAAMSDVMIKKMRPNITDYKLKRWRVVPKYHEEVQRWKVMFGEEQIMRLKHLWDELSVDLFMSFIKDIREGKLTERLREKLLYDILGSSGIVVRLPDKSLQPLLKQKVVFSEEQQLPMPEQLEPQKVKELSWDEDETEGEIEEEEE